MLPYARKAALASAVALTAGAALSQRRPVLLDGYARRDKLPIYPAAQSEIVLVSTTSDLEAHIASARESTTAVLRSVRDQTESVVGRWIALERRVAGHVRRVVPEEEALMPGAAWVGVSTLAGSLVARNRTFLLRLIAPPAFFLLSLPYFLPRLSANLAAELSSATLARAPELHAQASAFVRSADETFEAAEEAAEDARDALQAGAHRAVSFVERRTGLKLYEAFESSFARAKPPPQADRVVAVAVAAEPVGTARVPLFEQVRVPGGARAAAATTAPVPVQTVDVPVFQPAAGAQQTTAGEKLDAAAAEGLAKVEDALAALKHKAEDALHTAAPAAAAAASAEQKAAGALTATERKAAVLADNAQADLAGAAAAARSEAADVREAGAALATGAEAKAGEAKARVESGLHAAERQVEQGAQAAKDEGARLAAQAQAGLHEVGDKAAQAAKDAQAQALAAKAVVEHKAAAAQREAAELAAASEAAARQALADAQAKADSAASAVRSAASSAEAKLASGVAAVKQEAADTKRALDANDKVLKVDETTVDGQRQKQPPVVGLLAGREHESGYKKLV